ncbi:hypothetical protein [Nitrosomonas sp.]|jgi:hypothetical protein|uniref:hypothetical protein n=1 Tax=Nitrosomonas sp. TaxID=42353 RepID=UPI0025EAC441|nr:hypothetical protein [Nitrosomonas sp.]
MKIRSLLPAIKRLFQPMNLQTEDKTLDQSSQVEFLALEDRRAFEALCQFLWVQGEPLPLVFDLNHSIYTNQGITAASLQGLADAGLIRFEKAGFVKKGFGKHTRVFYCGKPTKIGFQADENNCLDLGHVLLTERGKQLASSIPVARNQQFYEYVISRWFEQGLLLSSIQIDRSWETPIVSNQEPACSIKE